MHTSLIPTIVCKPTCVNTFQAQIYADDGAMDDSSNVDEYFQTAVEFFIAADELVHWETAARISLVERNSLFCDFLPPDCFYMSTRLDIIQSS